MELWTLCRKPLTEKNIAENVLKYGTGGINIDECRIGKDGGCKIEEGTGGFNAGTVNALGGHLNSVRSPAIHGLGRYPANIIHDGSEDVTKLFPSSKSGNFKGEGSKSGGIWNKSTGKPAGMEYGDNGSASRFFYCAKASKKERNIGLEELEKKNVSHDGRKAYSESPHQRHENIQANCHPTVKPIKLMKYLCKLITPKNGIILDPFMGSGTTGIAAILENFDFIGIEKEKEYYYIAEKRIKYFQEKLNNKQLKIF